MRPLVHSATMRVLALQSYHGGSHQAFLEGWIAQSRHEFTPLTLPAHHWKWRMRHAAVTFADQLRDDTAAAFDALWCTSMLDLATFRGLAPAALGRLPAVCYFHENQLAYPVRQQDPRDVHFGLTQMTAALAADAVWWNSAYNQDTFLHGLGRLLRKMPDDRLADPIPRIREKSAVHPPGITLQAPAPQGERRRAGSRDPAGPLHLLWAARWEHDKDPDTFFAALERLAAQGVDFRVSVVGEQFREVPPVFARAEASLADRIVHWVIRPRGRPTCRRCRRRM